LADNPTYTAFGDDGLSFAAGPEAKKALGEALESKAAASAVLKVDIHMSKMAPAMASHHSEKEAAAIKKAMADSFKGEGGDGLHLSIKAGDAFTLSFSIDSAALRFITQVERTTKHDHKARPHKARHKKEKHDDDGDKDDDSDSDD